VARLPGADAAATLGDHPPPDRQDLAGLLGELEELRRQVQEVAGWLPADKGLEPDGAAIVEVDDRLVMHLELLAGLGASEQGGELATRRRRREQVPAEGH